MEITDVLIARLKALPKRITNPKARTGRKEKHQEKNYDVRSGDEKFELFVRQSNLVPDGFSCGLVWLPSDGGKATLTRYNGADHPHKNPIEGNRVDFQFHIHLATERYASTRAKVEHFASPTQRYSDVNGALQCLLIDWNITGLEATAPQESLL